MHLADEVRLGADPRVLGRGQLLVARADRLDDPRGGEQRVRRARRRLQLVRRHPGPRDRDLDRRLAHVRDATSWPLTARRRRPCRRVKPLVEQVREVLAAPARRLVQADRDDHELALERLLAAKHAHRLARAAAHAPFMSAEPRP